MSHNCIFSASEHKRNALEDKNFTPEQLKKLDSNAKNNKYLSIQRSQDEILQDSLALEDTEPTQPKAYYLIGYRWFKENETYLHVSPKIDDNQYADYMSMFLTCLKDPVVSQTIISSPDKLYKIFFDEPLIELDSLEDEITPFLILHFLQVVKSITKKGLKKGYIRVTENLTSNIKGKILINQTIKQNHLKNRLDKTVCNHQVFTINCIENQIIKTALMQCGGFLHSIKDDTMIKTLRQNINAFELVDTKEVFNNDFFKIKHSPFYKEYKVALNLAKMIFKRFGFALDNSSKNKTINKIPPYYINMPELFERYTEVKLREAGLNVIDGNKNECAVWSMKPDFLLPKSENQEPIIIDAKYKYWFDSGKNGEDKENAEYKSDYMQLSLYGRDMKVRNCLEIKDDNNEEVELLFIYPTFNNKDKFKDITLGSKESKEEIVDPIESHKFKKIKRLALWIPNKRKKSDD